MATWSNINNGLTGNAILDNHGGKVFAAANNILYKCVPGAIYKTENLGTSWSNVTPATDPVGSAASAVDYIWYASNKLDATKHYFLARNDIGGTWSSWILQHDSSASSNTWTTISGGGAATLGPSVININNQASPQTAATASRGVFSLINPNTYSAGPRNIAKASASLFTHSYQAFDVFSPYSIENKIVSIEYISATSLNSGSPTALPLPAGCTQDVINSPRAVSLSIDRVVSIYDYYHTVTGDYLNYVAVTEATTGSNNSGTPVRADGTEANATFCDIVNIDPARFFTVMARHSSSSFGILYRRGETAGRAITLDNEFNALDAVNRLAWNLTAATIDATTVAILMSVTPNGSTMGATASAGAVLVDIQGNSAVNTSFMPIDDANTRNIIGGMASKIAPSKLAWIFHNNSNNNNYLIIGNSVTSASIDWGPVYNWVGVPGTPTLTIETFGEDNRFIISSDSAGSDLGGANSGTWTSIVDVTGTCPNFGPITGSATDSVYAPNIMYNSGGSFITTYDALLATEELRVVTQWVNVSGGGGGGGKALGLALGGDGATLYGTYSDDTNLNLNVYDTSDMSLTRNVSMGAGTTNDTASKTRLAYPETIDNNDNFCYVYGRMLNPGGLSASMNHIIKTENAGVTFSNVENTWGRDHCGAMARRSWATPVAIRNIGNSIGGFYVGGSGLTLRSLLPFPVNPGGLYVTNNGFVIAGASTAETWPIRYTIWPYQRWAMLKRYPTDGGVTGITVL